MVSNAHYCTSMIAISELKSIDKCVTCQRVANPNVLQYANDKRNNGSFNDVIINVGDRTIAANRLILSCCSRFFEAMFDLEMIEKYQNPVQIHGVNGAAVESVVDFMYNGEVKITSKNVMELIAASDYLQVAEVKRFCFEFLELILSSDNWFVILSAAKLYENEDLQNQVYEYVSNNFNDVIQTDEFKSLAKNVIIDLISKLNRTQTKELFLFQGLVTWCQHDVEIRKGEFPTLFEELIDLDKMSTNDLEEIVLKEDLLSQNNYYCLKVVTNYLCQQHKYIGETRIVSLGGIESHRQCIEVYNRSNGPQRKFPELPVNVINHCSLKMGNYVYLIGGESSCDGGENVAVLPSVWRFKVNDKLLKWKRMNSLNEKRYAMGSAVFRDTMVVAGGYNGKNSIKSVEFYVAALDEWKSATPLPKSRCTFALVANDDYLYALGGWINNKCSASVQRIGNLQTNWEDIAPLQMPRIWFTAVVCNGIIYAIGGQTNQKMKTNTVEKYEFNEKKWIYVNNMNFKRSAHTACVLNGKIYVVGGFNASSEAIKSIECYDPKTDSWCIVGNTDVDLYKHSLIVL